MAFGTDPAKRAKIVWYWAKEGAEMLGIPTPFVSRNWDDEGLWPDLGEQWDADRPWRGGGLEPLPPGKTGPCGSKQVWEEGWPGPNPPGILRGSNGVGACCNQPFYGPTDLLISFTPGPVLHRLPIGVCVLRVDSGFAALGGRARLRITAKFRMGVGPVIRLDPHQVLDQVRYRARFKLTAKFRMGVGPVVKLNPGYACGDDNNCGVEPRTWMLPVQPIFGITPGYACGDDNNCGVEPRTWMLPVQPIFKVTPGFRWAPREGVFCVLPRFHWGGPDDVCFQPRMLFLVPIGTVAIELRPKSAFPFQAVIDISASTFGPGPFGPQLELTPAMSPDQPLPPAQLELTPAMIMENPPIGAGPILKILPGYSAGIPGLERWYKMLEGTGTNVEDSVSHQDGTITGATWSSDSPTVGFSIEFANLSSDVVICPHVTEQTNYSVFGRFKIPSGSAGGFFNIFGIEFGGGEGWASYVRKANNQVNFVYVGQSVPTSLPYPSPPDDWHDLLVTVEGTTIKRYVDGVFADTFSLTHDADAPLKKWWMGRSWFGMTTAGGFLTDVRYWVSVLDATQAMDVHNDTSLSL